MSANSQRALVPVKKLSPPAVIEKNRDLAPLDLVNGESFFTLPRGSQKTFT